MAGSKTERRIWRCKRAANLSGRKYSVFVRRTNRELVLHLFSRESGAVVCGLSTRGKVGAGNTTGAEALGKAFGEMLIGRGVKEVHFNRMGLLYHGRVEAAVRGLRDSGIIC